jgi:NitT/TauT family transport system substrate-binding protein
MPPARQLTSSANIKGKEDHSSRRKIVAFARSKRVLGKGLNTRNVIAHDASPANSAADPRSLIHTAATPELTMNKLLLFVLLAAIASVTSRADAETKIRMGHFPNITHAQGVIAHAMTRQGKGWFEQRLGNDVKIDWYTYNAGPSAMEAIFARSLDVTYVGTGPALNAHWKSNGAEIRVIGGGANGGAALLVAGDSSITKPADLRGKKIATPQFGNTQDISCRAWLKGNGINVTMTGGDAWVMPTANPDQLQLLQSGGVQAVWTVEPWVTRLEREAKARVLVEETNVITTWLVSSAKFLKENRELAKKIADANAELAQWIQANEAEAQKLLIAELKEETRSEFAPDAVAQAWKRIKFTPEVSQELVNKAVEDAKTTGFAKGSTDISKLIEKP